MRTRLSWPSWMSEIEASAAAIGEALGDGLVEMQLVDHVDDLHVPRQQAVEQLHRPALQRLRQQRVIGVAQGCLGDAPRVAPGIIVLIDQDAHQFGDRDRRMGVVELDRDVIGQRIQIGELLEMAADDVLQRRRGEEILLAQPQLLAGRRGVARIEHAGNRFGLRARRGRADHVAGVERRKLHRRGRSRRPKPQRVDVAAAPAGDRRIVRHRQDPLGRIPEPARRAIGAADIFDAAAEADGIFGVEPLEFPRVAEREPALRQLVLPAVPDLLLEQAVLVADAVAEGRHRQCRHAVHVASREAPEAAVAERGVGLELAQLIEIDAEAVERRARRTEQSQIDQRVEQQPPDQDIRWRGSKLACCACARCAARTSNQRSTMRSRIASTVARYQS